MPKDIGAVITLEQNAVQFMRAVYDILYKESDGNVTPDKNWSADTLDDIAEQLHQFIPWPSELLAESGSAGVRTINLKGMEWSDEDRVDVFNEIREHAMFTGNKATEVIIDVNAVVTEIEELDIPEKIKIAVRQAYVEAKNGSHPSFLLIVF